MSAITQASAQVAKTVAVTTGKVANAQSMMIWRPHGNKYVSFTTCFDAIARRVARETKTRGSGTSACESGASARTPTGFAASALGSALCARARALRG